jgi:hypothetical protein
MDCGYARRDGNLSETETLKGMGKKKKEITNQRGNYLMTLFDKES